MPSVRRAARDCRVAPLAVALDAHAGLVCELAGIRPGMRVLDAGCGAGEPARRIASRIDCEIIGLNISRRQVRQGRELIAEAGLATRVDIRHGNVLRMPWPDGGFDAAATHQGDTTRPARQRPAPGSRPGSRPTGTGAATGGNRTR